MTSPNTPAFSGTRYAKALEKLRVELSDRIDERRAQKRELDDKALELKLEIEALCAATNSLSMRIAEEQENPRR